MSDAPRAGRQPDDRATIPPAFRALLERLRSNAIAEANELSRLLGLPTVATSRDWERKQGGR